MIVLGCIAAALILIALIPVGVRLGYDEGGLRVRVMAGWLGISLYPQKKTQVHGRKLARQQKKARKRLEKQKPTPPPTPKAPKGISGIKPLLRLGMELLGDMRRKLVVRELYLRVWFGGADAARSAIRYGQACAVIGGVSPLLENMFTIQNRDVAAQWDPEKEQMDLTLRLDLRMRIGTLTALGVKMGIRFMQMQSKQKKAVQKNESSSV